MRLAFVGWGAMAHAAVELLTDPSIEIVAIATNEPDLVTDAPTGAVVLVDPSELASIEVDLVAEAASREAVQPWTVAAFDAGADVIVSSVSAFADSGVLEELREAASRTGRRLQIHPGAVAGVEALAAARITGIDSVRHRIVKPPLAWSGTPAEDLCQVADLTETTTFYSGNAASAAGDFPANANVAMTTALAGVGPEATQVELVADPDATGNRHELRAHGAFGSLEVSITNNPLPSNPKTSAMAALSLVRAIENRSAPIVV